MSDPTPDPHSPTAETPPLQSQGEPRYMAQPSDSYTKLAMKNMVRRRGTSLFHFSLTTIAVLGLLIGLSYLFH